MKRILILSLLCIGLTACGGEKPVQVGSKIFAENRILAQIFVEMLRERGIPVDPKIPYGNTFDLQEAVKEGEIDLYPEYSGTGLSMMGVHALSDPDKAMRQVRQLFLRFDLQWLERLGLNNSYVLVMQAEDAARLETQAISDLSGLDETLRIGCEEEFLARPVDGFQPLVRRYGFEPEPKPVVTDSRDELYSKLLSDLADVIVAQRTDPQIEAFGLTMLEDDLEFFPAYEAAPLVREKTLEQYPRLSDIFQELRGKISDLAMRNLNRKVEMHGMDTRSVAVQFLLEQGMIEKDPEELVKRKLVIAAHPSDDRTSLLAQSLDAVRRIFSNRRIEVGYFSSPGDAVIQDRGFVALMGAEDFFVARPGRLPDMKEHVEAVAPVGFREVHVIRPRRYVAEDPFAGVARLGVGPTGSSAEKMAPFLLDGYDQRDQTKLVNGDVNQQAEQVNKGELDALLVMAEEGAAKVTVLLDEYPLLGLQPLDEWSSRTRQYRYPFIRLSRIPETAYPGMKGPVETVGTQVVLGGPKPADAFFGQASPVSGMGPERQAIPPGVKQELTSALGRKEAIDPTLPGEQVALVTARRDVQPLNPAPAVSGLSALVFAAFGAFFYLLLRKQQRSP